MSRVCTILRAIELWHVLDVWRSHSASSVDGRALDSGHYLPEEQPEKVLRELKRFFDE
jgi:haloacetate dehalogenase